MKTIVLFTIGFCSAAFAQAQVTFEKAFGGSYADEGAASIQLSDGSFLTTGSISNGDNTDILLVHTNASGDTLWTRTYGGPAEDVAKSVIESSDGGFVITGYSKSFGDSLADVYTVKTNALGDTVWTNKFGLPGFADYGNEVIETMNHKFIVAGETSSYGTGGASDALAQEISATGSTGYVETDGLANMADNYTSVTQDAMGRIAMAGSTSSFGLNGDMFLVVTDSSWNFISATTFGSLEFDGAYSIDHTADRCFVLCGVTNSFNNYLDDIYLVKTDTLGFAPVAESVFVTSVQDKASAEKNAFRAFPNPADDIVYINVNAAAPGDEYELLITDVLGKEVEHRMVTAGPSSVNTTGLAGGMYCITLRNKDFSASQKLMVHH